MCEPKRCRASTAPLVSAMTRILEAPNSLVCEGRTSVPRGKTAPVCPTRGLSKPSKASLTPSHYAQLQCPIPKVIGGTMQSDLPPSLPRPAIADSFKLDGRREFGSSCPDPRYASLKGCPARLEQSGPLQATRLPMVAILCTATRFTQPRPMPLGGVVGGRELGQLQAPICGWLISLTTTFIGGDPGILSSPIETATPNYCCRFRESNRPRDPMMRSRRPVVVPGCPRVSVVQGILVCRSSS